MYAVGSSAGGVDLLGYLGDEVVAHLVAGEVDADAVGPPAVALDDL